jgi:hypothetical protein
MEDRQQGDRHDSDDLEHSGDTLLCQHLWMGTFHREKRLGKSFYNYVQTGVVNKEGFNLLKNWTSFKQGIVVIFCYIILLMT